MAEPGLDRVERLARELAEKEGLELVLVELVREPTGRILRVMLDKPSGVNLDDCQLVAEPLSRALDEDPPLKGSYALEVSSPGVERPLVRRADFERFAGEEVAVRLKASHEGRRKYEGVLVGLEGDDVVIESEGSKVRLPFKEIVRAHLVVGF